MNIIRIRRNIFSKKHKKVKRIWKMLEFGQCLTFLKLPCIWNKCFRLSLKYLRGFNAIVKWLVPALSVEGSSPCQKQLMHANSENSRTDNLRKYHVCVWWRSLSRTSGSYLQHICLACPFLVKTKLWKNSN